MWKQWYNWLCPCLNSEDNKGPIEIPLLNISVASEQQTKRSQRTTSERILIKKQAFSKQQNKFESSPDQKSDSFESFNKGSSKSKKSFKILAFSSRIKSSSEYFSQGLLPVRPTDSVDQDFTKVLTTMHEWTKTVDHTIIKLKQSELMDVQRHKKIMMSEVQNRIEQFQDFTEDHNVVYQNASLKMVVEFKEESNIFQNKLYTTLCKFKIQLPILAFFDMFNSIECQSRLANFNNYHILTTQPYLIIKTQQISNCFSESVDLRILKFALLMEEESSMLPKKYIVELDIHLPLNNKKHLFKRLTRVFKNQEDILEVQIYTEMSVDLKSYVDQREFFSQCHRGLCECLVKWQGKLKK